MLTLKELNVMLERASDADWENIAVLVTEVKRCYELIAAHEKNSQAQQTLIQSYEDIIAKALSMSSEQWKELVASLPNAVNEPSMPAPAPAPTLYETWMNMWGVKKR